MELKHLKGLDDDYRHQLRETRKMGGPSESLRRIKKRPENMYNQNARFNWSEPLPGDKCKCGNIKFVYQDVCYKCNFKRQNVPSKQIRQNI